ncbi:MAG: 4'-phosphopantetheinyl transferase superfamily protein, partial [Planctomycetes bacterium]|nr:4'-phosphopantetheinyl transferase superfamily protein [Planctomycetota bacterium]
AYGLELMSDEERMRFRSFEHERDAQAYAAGHVGLREALSERDDATTPGNWRFERRPDAGTAAIAPTGRAFGVGSSRAGGFAAFAIADTFAFGIDAVDVGGADWEAIGREFFAEPERDALANLEPKERPRTAARFWALKESFAKATGRGVDDEFAAWSFASASQVRRRFPDWTFWSSVVRDELEDGERVVVLACAARSADLEVFVQSVRRVGHPA